MKKIFVAAILATLAACGSKESTTNDSSTAAGDTTLPYLGLPEYVYTEQNGTTTVDTIAYTIPTFSFTDQDGHTLTEKDVAGKIYVADFFFTTCPSICPIMAGNLKKVQDKFKDNGHVMILSHSIDPTYDEPSILKKYAEEKGADTKFWKFLTGNKDSIYDICDKYMAFAQTSDEAPGGYLHSGFLVLIDKDRHIRGAYDGTDEGKTEDLIKDISILLKEK